MSYLDEIAAAIMQQTGPYSPVKMATINSASADSNGVRTVTVTYEGSASAPATWSSAFDVAMATKGYPAVVGMKVLLLLPSGQPFISDIIIGS